MFANSRCPFGDIQLKTETVVVRGASMARSAAGVALLLREPNELCLADLFGQRRTVVVMYKAAFCSPGCARTAMIRIAHQENCTVVITSARRLVLL